MDDGRGRQFPVDAVHYKVSSRWFANGKDPNGPDSVRYVLEFSSRPALKVIELAAASACSFHCPPRRREEVGSGSEAETQRGVARVVHVTPRECEVGQDMWLKVMPVGQFAKSRLTDHLPT